MPNLKKKEHAFKKLSHPNKTNKYIKRETDLQIQNTNQWEGEEWGRGKIGEGG